MDISTEIPDEIRTEKLSILKQLWANIITLANMYRLNGWIDGLGLWSILQRNFDDSTKIGNWKQSILPNGGHNIIFTNAFRDFPEYEGKIFIEKNHFFHQLVNIPNQKPLSILRLMQVALNIGQGFRSTQEILPKDFIERFWHIMIDIETYVDVSTLELVSVDADVAARFMDEFWSICMIKKPVLKIGSEVCA